VGESLGIPRTLELTDLLIDNPDQFQVISYVSLFYAKFKNSPKEPLPVKPSQARRKQATLSESHFFHLGHFFLIFISDSLCPRTRSQG